MNERKLAKKYSLKYFVEVDIDFKDPQSERFAVEVVERCVMEQLVDKGIVEDLETMSRLVTGDTTEPHKPFCRLQSKVQLWLVDANE